MSKAILSELKLLRAAMVRIAGGSGLPEESQLSHDILDKAAEDFRRLQTMNGQWLERYDLGEYFKIEDHRHNVGEFIIKAFQFSNYFKYKKTLYFNKADIVTLSKELKRRNVNLSRYIDFKTEEDQLLKNIQIAFDNKEAHKNMPYWLSEMVENVPASPVPRPPIEVVESEIKRLRAEFNENKLDRYIDVYQGRIAMIKFEHQFKKYFSNDLKGQCSRWCSNFNYALNALDVLDEKRANFVRMHIDDDAIEL